MSKQKNRINFSSLKCPLCNSRNLKKIYGGYVCMDCNYEMDEEELYDDNIDRYEKYNKRMKENNEDY